jgi:hypothetical protein
MKPRLGSELRLEPKRHEFGISAGIGMHHVPCWGYVECETELAETRTHAFHRDRATMGRDLMRTGYVVVEFSQRAQKTILIAWMISCSSGMIVSSNGRKGAIVTTKSRKMSWGEMGT